MWTERRLTGVLDVRGGMGWVPTAQTAPTVQAATLQWAGTAIERLQRQYHYQQHPHW